MLIETMTGNILCPRRKHDKNIHSSIWGRENLAEASVPLQPAPVWGYAVRAARAPELTEHLRMLSAPQVWPRRWLHSLWLYLQQDKVHQPKLQLLGLWL